ncbi:MAG TPA: hydroxysqualene dehydroxylase HpnE [Bryobacteraceae bacterium]|nr:hydroxysqualene dehydroxylase HpnE [Bryobacteraceae bacterium]
MPSVNIVGGGLAGLAAAAALGSAGFQVDLFESRPFLGGRATSFPVVPGDDDSELIDNCQHVLLKCCVNLLDFYTRLGVADRIHFYREFYFLEPGGRRSVLGRGSLPAPLHLTLSFLRMACLNAKDKFSIARGMMALMRERGRRRDLDQITMLDWLLQKRQTPHAIDRFWGQVLVSAVNEELDRMAAVHGFQVFWLGMLARADSYEMGVPQVPLRDLYSVDAWQKMGEVRIHARSPVERIVFRDGASTAVQISGEARAADFHICAVPFERLGALAPELGVDTAPFQHSPITGIHVWFDRPVTDLPHAVLLDRTLQWMFNKSQGRYLQFVVSASRELLETPRADVIELALGEAAEFFPRIREAKVEKATVIKEVRATYSASPGMEALRPQTKTAIPNVFLAGDWTRSGWPATMEGAVRSGYRAAEHVCAAAGLSGQFLLSDIA